MWARHNENPDGRNVGDCTVRAISTALKQNAVLMAAMDANKAEILRRTGAECPTPAYWVNPPTPVQVPCGGCNC